MAPSGSELPEPSRITDSLKPTSWSSPALAFGPMFVLTIVTFIVSLSLADSLSVTTNLKTRSPSSFGEVKEAVCSSGVLSVTVVPDI